MKVGTDILKQVIMFVRKSGSILLVLGLLVSLSLLWIFPQRGLNVVLYPNTEWKGVPLISQRVTQINLDPFKQQQAFPQRNFSTSWTGWIRIDQTGEYSFATRSDDGSSLFIDHQKIVKNEGFHAKRKVSSKIFLTQGMHSIKVLYFQGPGDYALQVSWIKPGKIETELPSDILYAQSFPIRGIGFFTRHRPIFYPLCWLLLIVILIKRGFDRKAGDLSSLLRECAYNTVVSIGTLCVCLFIIEGGMRIIFWFREGKQELSDFQQASSQDDETQASQMYSTLGNIVQASSYEGIVYELKPNLVGTFLGAPLHTNSKGLRAPEYDYHKPDNTFRIIGLGDSSMFGWGVDVTETSLHVLENHLNQQATHTTYEVINCGVPGYNTAIEVEVFLKKGLKYDPDLVILHFNTNDYGLPNFMKLPQSYSTFRKSYLLDFIYTRYQILRGKQKETTLAPLVLGPMEKSEFLDESPTIPQKYRHMVGKRGFLKAMDTLITLTQERNIPLLVFVIKSSSDIETFRGRQLQLISQLSQERNFWLLNTYSNYVNYLKAHPENSHYDFWLSKADTHPSILAHEIEAQALYDFLIEHKLVALTQ